MASRKPTQKEVLTAVATLADHAEGRVQHRLSAKCPRPETSPDLRDPACPVCQALQILRPRKKGQARPSAPIEEASC